MTPCSEISSDSISSKLKWDLFVCLRSVSVCLGLVVSIGRESLLLTRLSYLDRQEWLPCLAGLFPKGNLIILALDIEGAGVLRSLRVGVVFAERRSAIGVVVLHCLFWLWFVKAHIALTKFKRNPSFGTGSCKPYIQEPSERFFLLPLDD